MGGKPGLMFTLTFVNELYLHEIGEASSYVRHTTHAIPIPNTYQTVHTIIPRNGGIEMIETSIH